MTKKIKLSKKYTKYKLSDLVPENYVGLGEAGEGPELTLEEYTKPPEHKDIDKIKKLL